MSEAEILPTDQYYIRSEDDPAGRNLREDKSLFPKRVFCPTDTDLELVSTLWNFKPCNLTLIFLISLQWDIQRLDNGRYKLSARGAPVGAMDNLLFAFLIEQEKADEWVITWRKRDERNRNLYT